MRMAPAKPETIEIRNGLVWVRVGISGIKNRIHLVPQH